jgi:hypothetical protein
MDKRKINIAGKDFKYVLRKRSGVRSVRLSIHSDGSFAVSAPKWYPIYAINLFLKEKSDWILDKIKDIDFDGLLLRKNADQEKYKKYKETARLIIKERIEEFNMMYGFSINRVAIKNQKSCWGSCSQNKNLNFNYKVAFLEKELRDYVIVHELCHLQELNHSHKFWVLVAKTIPDFQSSRQKLRNIK